MRQKQVKFLGGAFTGGGQMGVLMRQFDWANTVLGSVENWSQSLRTSVSILLNCPYPIFICWGRESIVLYNDACIPLVADKHPHALGQKIPHVLPELWYDRHLSTLNNRRLVFTMAIPSAKLNAHQQRKCSKLFVI
ncbi:hypothetical protein [Scytonema sp. UIC 10036]|uniref:hypothetical protein n=1 Tax=Scytonema sp. UIC 10036 TaxID=2304196 RepID=UPI001A9BD980|nr:hypothetical protein [Scytonema sp. UIC 10036]